MNGVGRMIINLDTQRAYSERFEPAKWSSRSMDEDDEEFRGLFAGKDRRNCWRQAGFPTAARAKRQDSTPAESLIAASDWAAKTQTNAVPGALAVKIWEMVAFGRRCAISLTFLEKPFRCGRRFQDAPWWP